MNINKSLYKMTRYYCPTIQQFYDMELYVLGEHSSVCRYIEKRFDFQKNHDWFYTHSDDETYYYVLEKINYIEV